MKRLTSFVVALVLATTALWAYDFKSGDLYYNITSSTKLYTVEVIPYSDYYEGLTSATIPATVTYGGTTYSVTSIGEYAFSRCTGLTSITIPNSVTSIGRMAFYGCIGLTSITIPNSVTSIGYMAFGGCTGLTSVVWNAKKCSGWSDYAVYPFYSARNNISSFTFGNEVDSIPDYLCYEMSKLTSVIIPNSVTSIGYGAFHDCTGLTSITIPNSVTSIGEWAFSSCTGLTSVIIPNSVTSIGECAFKYCTGLTSVVAPALFFDTGLSTQVLSYTRWRN